MIENAGARASKETRGTVAQLIVDEIFYSIQGEARDAGRPCVFLRLSFCDLRCRYCDTKHSWKRGQQQSDDEVLEAIAGHGCRLVCVTGGEPMLQREALLPLIERMLGAGYEILLETHGMAALDGVPAAVTKILDVKAPASFGVVKGVDESALYPTLERNLTLLTAQDQLKFVIGSRADFDWALDFVRAHALEPLAERLLFSPSHGVVDPRDLSEWLKASGLAARLNLQLHKYIWGADVRGV